MKDNKRTRRSLPCFLIHWAFVTCLATTAVAQGQIAYPEQELHVHDLPLLTSRSPHAAEVLATSLEIILRNKEVCCGKDSALEDSLQAADPKSMKDIAGKLQGRHLLSDGRPIMVTTEFLTPDQVMAGNLIFRLATNHVPLMMWNSRIYVVSGVTYVENVDDSGAIGYVIHKFLLQDVRFSDARRAVTFDRLTEDAAKVQGLLFIEAAAK
jgi:hypothetical protein